MSSFFNEKIGETINFLMFSLKSINDIEQNFQKESFFILYKDKRWNGACSFSFAINARFK